MPEIILSVRQIPKTLIAQGSKCGLTCVTRLITKSEFNANCLTLVSNTYIIMKD